MQQIDTVRAAGNITAQIQATGSNFSVGGNVTNVDSTQGRVLGDIFAQRQIVQVLAGDLVAGSVGTATRPVVLEAGTSVTTVDAGESLNINVRKLGTASNPQPVDSMSFIRARTGDFFGTIRTLTIPAGTPGQEGLRIGGSLLGQLICTGSVNRFVIVEGSITTSGSIQAGQINSIITVRSNLLGSVNTSASLPAGSAINVNGDVFGTLSVNGDMSGSIVIGRALKAGGLITMPGNALKGQITLNAAQGIVPTDPNGNGFEYPYDAWQGEVRVDGFTLSPAQFGAFKAPFYQVPSSQLGGGSIGVVPFAVHYADCYPPMNVIGTPSLPSPPNDPNPLLTSFFTSATQTPTNRPFVRFYGPVMRPSVTPQPPAIPSSSAECGLPILRTNLCIPPGDVMDWFALGTIFEGQVGTPASGGANNSAALRARSLTVSRAPTTERVPEGIFRLRSVALRSIGAETSAGTVMPPVCAGSDTGFFAFRVGPDCDNDALDDTIVPPNSTLCIPTCGDFNRSGSVGVQDIFDFLNAWFAGCTTGSEPGTACQYGSGDFNRSGAISPQDIFDFLAAWFSGNTACNP